ncbi:MAG: protein arginine kinase [Bacillota bacterium]
MRGRDMEGKGFSKWMEGSGPHSDIVISSRIRLARNLADLPFPHMSEEAQQQAVDAVNKALLESPREPLLSQLRLVRLGELGTVDRQILVEKHLISPQHAQSGGHKAVLLNQDETLSIMVNEEDHLRIQCLLPALQLHEAWRLTNELDNALEQHLSYAFSETMGYLTTCPTNVGTGLRASVMVHLPALVMTKQAGRVLSALSQVGLAVRGLYGEGTEAIGNIFQISNQITLGQTEEEIIHNLSAVAKQIIDQERGAREILLRDSRLQLEDRVYRAYGILSNARIISSQEALALMSETRLGIDLKLIKGLDARIFNELLLTIQPAYLQKAAGAQLEAGNRDVKRAALIRHSLGEQRSQG